MNKTELTRFLTLDCATTNTGFALFDDSAPVKWGKLHFDGNTEYEKVMSATRIMYAFVTEYPVDTVIIESSFFGSNPRVGVNLALSQGAALAGATLAGVEHIAGVVPSQWQRGIGNNLLTRDERSAIMKEYPDKSASWYKNRGRLIRKQRTVDIVNDRYVIGVRDYDVADAVGIGLFASDNPDKVTW